MSVAPILRGGGGMVGLPVGRGSGRGAEVWRWRTGVGTSWGWRAAAFPRAIGSGTAPIARSLLHDFVVLGPLFGVELGLDAFPDAFGFLAHLGLHGLPDGAVPFSAFLEDGVDAGGLGVGEVEVAFEPAEEVAAGVTGTWGHAGFARVWSGVVGGAEDEDTGGRPGGEDQGGGEDGFPAVHGA